MKKDQLISINEREFLIKALKEGFRIDSRKPFDFRSLKIGFGDKYGEVEVRLGQTRVYAVVTSEIVEPFPDRPTEGFFNFNVEFSPMADPNFEVGRPGEAAIELGRVIERGLRESRAIDTEALCILAKKKVFSIRCDIHILDNCGNLIDCASIATITALLHFRREEVSVSGDNITVHSMADRDPIPLSIHHIPVCVTFAFFEDGDLFFGGSESEGRECDGGEDVVYYQFA
eukprot:TRINITY_DN4630_c0_g1_i8.p1 TRINITY_DN4630_c0_g1~~TRINITY_DN4630_c0_g1_i8.p1  ORF type:complete len:259 (-),score=74.83 TRINITY_DN4630_c0_g1_i8:268-957(-)